jgi:hypothetical protein
MRVASRGVKRMSAKNLGQSAPSTLPSFLCAPPFSSGQCPRYCPTLSPDDQHPTHSLCNSRPSQINRRPIRHRRLFRPRQLHQLLFLRRQLALSHTPRRLASAASDERCATHKELVPRKFTPALEEVPHGRRRKPREEPFGALGSDDLAAGGEERVALEIGVDLDAGLDYVDGWGLGCEVSGCRRAGRAEAGRK